MHKNMLCNENWLLRCSSYDSALGLCPRSYAVSVPSVWEEPLPYVIKEIMAMGTMPIASKVGGTSKIVIGTYAEKVMFNLGDSDEMVDKMNSGLSLSNGQLIGGRYELRKDVCKGSIFKSLDNNCKECS